jgi:hypothetical protein
MLSDFDDPDLDTDLPAAGPAVITTTSTFTLRSILAFILAL